MIRETAATRRPHAPNSPASERPAAPESDTQSATLTGIERFLLGEITADQLSLDEFSVWLDGYMSRQREIDDLQEEVRLRDAIDARRGGADVRPLLGPTFAELSRIRREPALAARAEEGSRRRSGETA